MSQRLFKGRTRNHISWVMVDSADFASTESALSAAMKIKVYGKLRADATVYFVSSGAGSLTEDVKHVGASALGLYTLALAKADLSDASAAWYDQYIFSFSATGAAYQALVCEGVIDESAISVLISDAVSAAQQANSRVLVAQSAASDAASAAAQANSRILLVQSRLSDLDSRLASEFSDMYSLVSDLKSNIESRVPKEVAARSQLSDLHSDLRSFLVVMSGVESDIYSALSDFQSDFGSRVPKRVATDSQLSDVHSDLKSAIAGITASVSASDISDIASAVWAHTVGTRVDSRVLLNLSRISDTYSLVSDLQSDFQSRVPKRVATDSQLSDVHSDLASKIAGITASVSASDISDIASAVKATLASDFSDLYSLLSDLNSNILSRVPKEVASKSLLSDVHSDLRSQIAGITASVSASDISDIASAVWAHTVGTRVDSRILVIQSTTSDIRSQVSDLQSDFQSRVPKRVATDSQLSDVHSDLRSQIAGLTVTVGASDISDIASAVRAALVSDLSDIHSAATAGASRALLNQSRISDVYSLLSDFQSDFVSRIPKEPAARSQLSDLASDLRSVAVGLSGQASDIYSLLSDLHSDVAVMSGVESDIYSALQAGLTLTAAERNAIADAHLDRADAIETGLTPRGAHRLEAAAAAGKLTGAATTNVLIRNAVADSKNRIDATVDQDGNRTAITTDVT